MFRIGRLACDGSPAPMVRDHAAKGEQLRAAGRERQSGNGRESAGNPARSRDLAWNRQVAAAAVSPAVSQFAVQHGSEPLSSGIPADGTGRLQQDLAGPAEAGHYVLH